MENIIYNFMFLTQHCNQMDFHQGILGYEMIKLHKKDFIQEVFFHYIVFVVKFINEGGNLTYFYL